MGKKRNNATKKKQAAAKKKRLSSTYGVSVLKGGITHCSKQNNANASIGIDGKQGKKGGANNGEGNTKHILDNTLLQQQPGKKRARNSNDISEQDDFNHQYSSLEERSLALTARKAELQKKKKGNRRQQKKKGWGSKFAGPSSTTTTVPKFAPATLSLAPKSTQQLVDDAANEVARGMNEIGSRSNHQQSMMVTNPVSGGTAVPYTALPGQSSLAAAASHNWKLRVSNLDTHTQQRKQQQAAQSQSNPYAALDTDSDDDSDNEWSDKKKQKVVQQFQFKPASFSFQSSSATATSNNAVSNIPQIMGPSVEDNDIDPDL